MVAPMVIAAGLQAAASLLGGIGQNSASKAQARALREQAREEETAGAFQALDIERMERAAAGVALVEQAASGVQTGSGSALDTLRQSAWNREFDIAVARYEAGRKADSLRAEAKAVRRAGRAALLGGVLGAGGAVAGGLSGQAAADRVDSAADRLRAAQLPRGASLTMPVRGR